MCGALVFILLGNREIVENFLSKGVLWFDLFSSHYYFI